MRKILIAGASIYFLMLVLFVAPVLAQGDPKPGGDPPPSTGAVSFELPNPLECKEAECILNTIIRTLIVIGAPLAVLMILVGAFQIMTAGGSTEKVETGRKTITYAVIGFAILLLSSSFIYIIKDLLGASD